jgi:hypothetical protein
MLFTPTAGGSASSTSRRMEPLVDIALKLNVVVVCAVFLFVGAILIGAF